MPVQFNQSHTTGHWATDERHAVVQHRHDDLEDGENTVLETPLDPALVGVVHFDPYKDDAEQERAADTMMKIMPRTDATWQW